ncbi:helix-hairpin-helix domain-containing protein [Cupriavidus basilensis]
MWKDCVNAVGVDVNTASALLLARVSGLNTVLARNIVEYRDANGAFANRDALKKVPRLGDKTFEQLPPASCASTMATIRWTAPRCTRKPTLWSSASSTISRKACPT